MQVMTAQEAREGNTGVYHILDSTEEESLCRVIKEQNDNPVNILTKHEAEQRGLRPCKKCLNIRREQT